MGSRLCPSCGRGPLHREDAGYRCASCGEVTRRPPLLDPGAPFRQEDACMAVRRASPLAREAPLICPHCKAPVLRPGRGPRYALRGRVFQAHRCPACRRWSWLQMEGRKPVGVLMALPPEAEPILSPVPWLRWAVPTLGVTVLLLVGAWWAFGRGGLGAPTGPPPAPPTPTASPSPTPGPTPTPTGPLAMPVALPTPTPVPTPTPRPSPTPTPTPTATPTPTPTLVPVAGPSDLVRDALRRRALALLNGERSARFLPPLELGSNPAPQVHAEDLVQRGCASPWGSDGSSPAMRYFRAGGSGFPEEAEVLLLEDPTRVPDPWTTLETAVARLLEDPLQRTSLLRPSVRQAHIGIAFGMGRFALVVLVERGGIQWWAPPSLKGGLLTLVGDIERGVPVALALYRAPMPRILTCRDLQEPPYRSLVPPGDPEVRLVPADPALRPGGPPNLPLHLADQWEVTGTTFRIQTDMTGLLVGPGLYTGVLWARQGEEEFPAGVFTLRVLEAP